MDPLIPAVDEKLVSRVPVVSAQRVILVLPAMVGKTVYWVSVEMLQHFRNQVGLS